MIFKIFNFILYKSFSYCPPSLNKVFRILFLVSISLLISVLPVQAHPGRTDSYGGHHVTATGEYHYHNGEPTPSYRRFTTSTGSDNKSVSKNKSVLDSGYILFFGFIFAIVISAPILEHFENKKRLKQFEEEKNHYLNLYGRKSAYELADVPKHIKFDDKDLPISDDESGLKWGKEFTVYKTSNGQCYHRKFGCSGASTPVHIFNLNGRMGCGKCTSERNVIPDWYKVYLDIKRIKKRYGI